MNIRDDIMYHYVFILFVTRGYKIKLESGFIIYCTAGKRSMVIMSFPINLIENGVVIALYCLLNGDNLLIQ